MNERRGLTSAVQIMDDSKMIKGHFVWVINGCNGPVRVSTVTRALDFTAR